jgi:hypothetical protein
MKSTFLPVLSHAVSIFAMAALLGGSALAQTATPPAKAAATPAPGAPAAPAEKPKPLPSGDETYVKNAIKGLNYLIQVANAAKDLTDPKDPAARLKDTAVKDLTAALGKINKIAEEHALKAPTELVGAEKTDLDRLNKAFAKPDKIDPKKGLKEWAAEMVKQSKRLDHETELAGKTAQDADVKTFISNYGPSIRNVYTTAESTQKGLLAKKTK